MSENNDLRYPCPCCGSLTLSEPAPGTYEICPVCGWEDDDVQFREPDLEEGANHMSLNQARAKYAAESDCEDSEEDYRVDL